MLIEDNYLHVALNDNAGSLCCCLLFCAAVKVTDVVAVALDCLGFTLWDINV